jgi:hypothetical protein
MGSPICQCYRQENIIAILVGGKWLANSVPSRPVLRLGPEHYHSTRYLLLVDVRGFCMRALTSHGPQKRERVLLART